MTATWVKFLAGSLCLHVAVFALLLGRGPVAHGIAGSANSPRPSPSALAVKIIAGKTAPRHLPAPLPPLARATEPQQPTPQQPAADTRRRDDPIATPDLSLDAILAGLAASPAVEDYLAAGSLTRLPHPIADLDLNISELTDVAVPGTKLSLIILVDAHGMVADVITDVATVDMRLFAARVAERFKSARFMPGEINGKPVLSQLRITVVSKDYAAREKPEIISIETIPSADPASSGR